MLPWAEARVPVVCSRCFASNNREMYFRDGKRRIDYVLVYRRTDVKPDAVMKRNAFLTVLAQKRIEIEVEDCDGNIIAGTGQNLLDDQFDDALIDEDLQKTIWPIKRITSIRMDEIDSKILTGIMKWEVNPWRIDITKRLRGCLKRRLKGFHFYKLDEAKRIQYDTTDNLVYVKLHASWPLMISYADALQFRKPLKKVSGYSRTHEKTLNIFALLDLKSSEVTPISFPFTSVFQKSKLHLFDISLEHRDDFFTQAERTLVLNYLLRRAGTKSVDLDAFQAAEGSNATTSKDLDEIASSGLKNIQAEEIRDLDLEVEISNATDDKKQIKNDDGIDYGIAKLLKDKVFVGGYPLHEPLPRHKVDSRTNTRMVLHEYWASYENVFRQQPLDYVRLYFGETVAFYFAWLGFYTQALVPATVVGFLIFCSGIYRFFTDELAEQSPKLCVWAFFSRTEVCDSDLLMCPQCRNCTMWLLRNACTDVRLSRLLDHEGTIFFAVFMAFWATVFMELWKREQNRLAYRWDMHEVGQVEEPPRPEYISLIGTKFPASRDYNLAGPEPHIPFWRRKFPITLVTISVILFSIVLCIAILIGIIFFKTFMGWYLKSVLPAEYVQFAAHLGTMLGAVLSLLGIQVLTAVYSRVAKYLTDMEHHRTQTQYDNALTLKLYVLQFFNYYSVICYIAFFKGPTAFMPGNPNAPLIASYGCASGDCVFDLFLQMVFVMIGRQILNYVIAIIKPLLCRVKTKIQFFMSPVDEGIEIPQDVNWAKHERARLNRTTLAMCKHDFSLADMEDNPVFYEYLEMLVQFGFMTLFVSVFPVAPLFALLNNMLEIRADAQKFLHTCKRPVAVRTKSIGIWINILKTVSRVAVRTNALIIALAMQFIPRLVYRIEFRPQNKQGLEGYMNFMLSYMTTDRFSANGSAYTYCRYWDFRNPPWSVDAFGRSSTYYHVLAARFIFIFLFENVVVGLSAMVGQVVPNMPRKLALIMQREAAETNEIIIHAEMSRAARLHHNMELRPLTHCLEVDYGEEYSEEISRLIRQTDASQEHSTDNAPTSPIIDLAMEEEEDDAIINADSHDQTGNATEAKTSQKSVARNEIDLEKG